MNIVAYMLIAAFDAKVAALSVPRRANWIPRVDGHQGYSCSVFDSFFCQVFGNSYVEKVRTEIEYPKTPWDNPEHVMPTLASPYLYKTGPITKQRNKCDFYHILTKSPSVTVKTRRGNRSMGIRNVDEISRLLLHKTEYGRW
jgi:hypothetical protein